MSDGNALKLLTYGVYFLGCGAGDEVNGMIASWVTQVSFEPRRVAVGVKKTRRSHELLLRNGVFTICVLDSSWKDKLDLFKGKKVFSGRTISGVPFETRKTGAPVLTDCVAFIECETVKTVDTGDHTLFIGEVVNEEVKGDETPLRVDDLEGHYYGG